MVRPVYVIDVYKLTPSNGPKERSRRARDLTVASDNLSAIEFRPGFRLFSDMQSKDNEGNVTEAGNPILSQKVQVSSHPKSVTGLMFGVRGTIPNFSSQFCKTLGLHKSFLNELALLIIKESVKLLRNHVYGL
ncbi:hypothetical protein ANN_08983 [Periplaneta americana]|uniref:Uncharacterized protein n=1 Tax=Periplaneta americana TaxID=6978 RepID=A0ABQ8TKA9_PERAM|nr:hypothetical protein ANN_08983 [Periplaneta americana]